VYWAKKEIAELYRRDGQLELAHRLEQSAERLRARFNRDFWLSQKNFYALALEANNRRAGVISSNPGHALWTGIADANKAHNTMQRLMEPDMFTGWGIRTLSSQERRYNPIGYHLGTVWPHDNAIIAAGFRRYGLDAAASRLFSAMLDASTYFPETRLPEAFAGLSRKDYGVPVRYPVACHPQAWAAGAMPFMLQTALGLQPDGFAGQLAIVRPVLPEMVRWVELRQLRVGHARLDLRFERQAEGDVTVEVLQSFGEVEVSVEPASAARRGRARAALSKEKKVA
jgi:glycogen debranching enzyme